MSWLARSIAKGFKLLVPLSLDRMPATENIPQLVEAWEKVLAPLGYAEEGYMAPRIARAFADMAANASRWPAPSDLRKAIPPEPPEMFRFRRMTDQEIETQRMDDAAHWERIEKLTGERFRPQFLSVPPGHPKVAA